MSEPSLARTALVVDDDPIINHLLQARLSAKGFVVSSSPDGESALEAIRSSLPDLVFLDVTLPGISGLQVLAAIRAAGYDIAVIMTTAYGSEKIAIDALRRGADDYLRKPFEASEFITVLDRTVARLELKRQNAVLRVQLDEKRQQLEAEISRAAKIQRDLLPKDSPSLPGFQLAAQCISAKETGGDFYDWHELRPGLFAITLGDVMGKGMPAALLMATIRAALRAVAPEHGPAETVHLVARALHHDLERSESFVTLFHAHLGVASGRLLYVDAGHGHAFIARAGSGADSLEVRGLPLGIDPGARYEEGVVQLGRGDALVVYSDGILGAGDETSDARATLLSRIAGASTAEAMARALVSASAVPSPEDDLTALVLYRTQGQ